MSRGNGSASDPDGGSEPGPDGGFAPDPEGLSAPFPERVAALQSDLDDETLLCYPGPNARYVAGVTGEPLDRHFIVAVEPTGEPLAVTPPKSRDLFADRSWIDRTVAVSRDDPAALARRVADEVTTNGLLVDERAPFAISDPLRAATDATLSPATDLLGAHRLRKDDAEVAALRRSAALADGVSREVRALGADLVGRTEREVAAEIRSRLHARGATRVSFDVVVASGPNAARPYLRHGERTIAAGDPVILDFGGFLDGYASDQTRTTVPAGEPPAGFAAAHEAVVDAFEAGVDAVEPGVTAGAIDRTVESALVDRGYGDAVVHATGHGVGLEAHEAPTVAAGNDTVLEPGMVFSVEPGVYLDGEFGVRVEDLVVVTGDGCERLNDSPKTWRPL